MRKLIIIIVMGKIKKKMRITMMKVKKMIVVNEKINKTTIPYKTNK
jgi:hypothetical protein